jgi:hypothetical protein
MPQQDQKPQQKPRYFERPDRDEKPLTLRETLLVVLSSHLGVRSRERRHEDFRRANGLHLFIAGVLYFAALIVGLVFLVKYIAA